MSTRTTLTLDDDILRKIKKEIKISGASFKEVVNEYLRLGLSAKERLRESSNKKFQIKARPLGEIQGLSYDNISELLDRIEK